MIQIFTEDFAGLPASTLNWIALGVGVLIILIVLLAIFRLFRGSNMGSGRRGRHARLAVTDAASIGDDRRKLVLIRRDNVEHLLLIGGSNDLVVESDIIRTAPQQTASRTPATPVAATAEQPQLPPETAGAQKPVVATPAPIASPPPTAVVATPAPSPAPAPQKPTPEAVAATAPSTPASAPVAAMPIVVSLEPDHTSAPISPPTIPTPAPSSPPVVNTETKIIAASTASQPAPVSVSEHSVETDMIASPVVADEKMEESEHPQEENITPMVGIDIPSQTPQAADQPPEEPQRPLNPVEEMDALLNEITTEK